MVFKKIEPGTWNPEKEGDSIEGVLIKIDEDVGKFKSKVYNLQMESGDLMAVWGSTVLDRKMIFVNIDDKIRITFTGKEPSKSGQDTKLFDVEVDRE